MAQIYIWYGIGDYVREAQFNLRVEKEVRLGLEDL